MMFGLKNPLARDMATPEFDNINTILSNSVYKKSSRSTLPCCDDKGKIFYLELSENDNSSPSHDNCGTHFSDHATDDTGYGSENDEHLNSHDVTLDSSHTGINPSANGKIEIFGNYSKFIDPYDDRCLDITGVDMENVDFSKMDGIRKVRLKVKPVDLRKVDTSNKSRKPGQLGRILCKELIGIIPGHFRTKVNGKSSNGQRLCVRGLVPHCHAAKYSNIQLGDCLRLVNGREVTWDNIDDVFLTLSSRQEVTIVLQQVITRQSKVPVLTKICTAHSDQTLIQLIRGQQEEQTDPEVDNGPNAVLFIDLEKLKSEIESGEDMVYHYPTRPSILQDVRGTFVTLFYTVSELSETGIRRSSFHHKGELVHVCYHREENYLLLLMIQESRISGKLLPKLLEELVRFTRVLHSSVIDAFSKPENHKDLNAFFSLFFHAVGLLKASDSDLQPQDINDPYNESIYHLRTGVQYLPLAQPVSDDIERLLNGWEAADWGHRSEHLFGCRRTFTILGSCLFYKSWLLCSHLPKEDLLDIYLFLRYQCLLLLCQKDKIQQLVIWQEINSTRQSYDLGEEQMFGYTEPVDAKMFWLIVGYENSIMCSLLEARGDSVRSGKSLSPDSWYIDQAKTTLMQINALDLSLHCDQRSNLQSIKLATSLKNEKPFISQPHVTYPVTSSPKLDISLLHRRRLGTQLPGRKDSIQSNESVDSSLSGGSLKRLSKNRTSTESRDDKMSKASGTSGPIKLTSGADNCLLHFLHMNKYEGIFVSPTFEAGHIDPEVIKNFHSCCSQIKHMFDKYRYRRKTAVWNEDKNGRKIPVVPDKTFYNIREEGVLFTVPDNKNDENSPTASYWVVGRKRSKEENYVCFKDGTPQIMVEMAFGITFGLNL